MERRRVKFALALEDVICMGSISLVLGVVEQINVKLAEELEVRYI